MDMSQTIAANSEQLTADDLMGADITIRITRVSANEATPEQPVNVFYEGGERKPFRPCKLMRRVMVSLWGADASAYVGRSMMLYRDPEVMFGKMKVGGVRIRRMSHIKEARMTVALTETRGKKGLFTVLRLDGHGSPAPEPEPEPQQPPALDPAMKDRALLAAQQGTVTFTAFWQQADVKPHRPALQSILPECQNIAKEADAKGAPTEGDPFTGGDREREPGED